MALRKSARDGPVYRECNETRKKLKSSVKNAPRIHHYLPQCYLRGFARSPTKNAQLHVLDVNERRRFATTCRNVAAERDFNRVDAEGFDPGALEAKLAEFEGKVAPVLQGMRETRTMPDRGGFVLLMNLVAAVAIRNPSMRKMLHRSQAQLMKVVGDLALASKD